MTSGRVSFLYSSVIMILLFILTAVPLTTAASFSGLEWVSSDGTSGSVARVPLVLSGVTEPIATLDLSLAYNPSLLTAIDVVKSETLKNATLTLVTDRGLLHLTITTPDGLTDGVIGAVRFNVLASSGTSPLRITHLAATGGTTRSPLVLPRKEGTLSIIPGLSFSTSSTGQRIAVDRSLASGRVAVNGSSFTFSRDGILFTCDTDGLAEGAGRVTGIVREVTATTTSSLDLPQGMANATFSFTSPTYLSESRFISAMDADLPPAIQATIRSAAEQSGLNLSTILLSARVRLEGLPTPPALIATFTFPASLHPATANETIAVASLKESGAVEITRPAVTKGDDTFTITTPIRPDHTSLAVIKGTQVAKPPSTVPPRTTSENIFAEGGQAAGISIWTGMFLIFFLVAVVVIGVFYVHRRRGG